MSRDSDAEQKRSDETHGANRCSNPEILLELRSISKEFGGIKALNNVDFSVTAGEVHVLLGENGAGKSTLIKIIAGAYERDSGEYLVEGRPIRKVSPSRMRQLGVSVIYQELSLVRQLDVVTNIFLGREMTPNVFGARFRGILDREAMRLFCDKLFRDLQISIDPNETVGNLSIAEMQLVEIARAVAFKSKVILMDEPTTSIGTPEKQRLFGLVKTLVARGIGVVFVSHILEDCLAISDRITVIRDGNFIATVKTAEATVDLLVRLMTGRTLTERYPRIESRCGDLLLEAISLGRSGKFQDVNFHLHEGEILGFAGLVGAGRTDVMHALYGLDPSDRGTVRIRGETLQIRSSRAAIRAGISLLTEDRKSLGNLPNLSLRENIAITIISVSLQTITSALVRLKVFLRFEPMRHLARRMVGEMRIKSSSIEALVTELSGGNQQKVLLARALSTNARVVILDEPTKGVDAGAKIEIYRMLEALIARRIGIIVVSSELPEVLALSNRIVVMKQGRITATLDRDRTTGEEIMRYATAEPAGEHRVT